MKTRPNTISISSSSPKYYEFSVSNTSIMLTEGVHTMKQTSSIRGLFDSILFYQKDNRITLDLQVWKLQKRAKGWLLTCSDHLQNVTIAEEIPHLDYYQPAITLFVQNNVCMLPWEQA